MLKEYKIDLGKEFRDVYIMKHFKGTDYYLLTNEQVRSGDPRPPSQRWKKSPFKKF